MTLSSSVPVTERVQASRYFERVHQTFENMMTSPAQRKYAQAIRKAFDQAGGAPMSPTSLCERFGYEIEQSPSYFLVLNKQGATNFFVEDCALAGLNFRSIRNVDENLINTRLSRSLEQIGRGYYWLTPAEWMTILNIPGELPLPDRIYNYLNSNEHI